VVLVDLYVNLDCAEHEFGGVRYRTENMPIRLKGKRRGSALSWSPVGMLCNSEIGSAPIWSFQLLPIFRDKTRTI
jgi:hypothetical protein